MNNHTSAVVSKLPDCDFCAMDGKKVKALYDARTHYVWTQNAWANVCQKHFDQMGCELGLGYGQKLTLK